MTTMRRDPLVDDYLRRLRAAAADLPRDRRTELVEEIEAHVDEALGEAGAEALATFSGEWARFRDGVDALLNSGGQHDHDAA